MSQKIVFDLLKSFPGGKATTKELQAKIKEKYPNSALDQYVRDRLSKLKKWGYIRQEGDYFIVNTEEYREDSDDSSEGVSHAHTLQYLFKNDKICKVLDFLVEGGGQQFEKHIIAHRTKVAINEVSDILGKLERLELVVQEGKAHKFNGGSEVGIACETFIAAIEEIRQKQKQLKEMGAQAKNTRKGRK